MGPGATLTDGLARFVVELSRESIPDVVFEDATRRVVDAVGVGISAIDSPYAVAVAGVAAEYAGGPEATTLGFGQRMPAALAAMVNASLIHGHDFDDMHSRAMVHISCITVPPALALAERLGSSGADCLAAIVAGAEVGLHLGAAAPHRFILRGWHGTSVCGTFAAAAVASNLLRLDASQTANALGLAASQSAGIMQGLHDGSWVKRMHPGWAVQSGMMAAALAVRGFTGPREALEGSAGLYSVFLRGDEDSVDLSAILAGLGTHWMLPGTSYKKYPTGAWTQAAMDGVSRLLDEAGLTFAAVERVECAVPAAALPVVCEPRGEKLHPRTAYQAKFSLPFCVAARAVLGHNGVDDYNEELVTNPDILSLAERVHCGADAALDPTGFPVRVEVITRNGRSLRAGPLMQPGSPENPMTDAEHTTKFLTGVEPRLGATRAAELLDWLRQMNDAIDMAQLRRLVSAGRKVTGITDVATSDINERRSM